MLTGTYTVKKLITLYRNMKELLQHGGFELKKGRSNNDEVNKIISSSYTETTLKLDKEPQTLDITWNSETDTFKVNVEINQLKIIKERSNSGKVLNLYSDNETTFTGAKKRVI